ncbi:MAG: single-stranded-DNA-specific exonuclease RecJ [Clostridium sp.]|uniref:single-stranded-DNA-specific exonuclease RecJ n=1 Tax=Clostridium sp. TaxID=1506 RepID=UPI0025BEECBA|nr:single-stranded-DNA-specific exonuclease RecJ [Clostridium sp.]MCH3964352.1 single-stranded-DNA-specific exonuclease RecJ [Clostridium sp.]MCI1715527.1 single-stranded-DNA-specific exonuclease RecJ [Clostridium sp.]MCI1799681.1 single-stranded-DNA-specific exonuclease RecJ [Clostridium sp.]MCI1813711.1 single-stranded-DNA-specific exonuclease RecJ [Clostridium sp.]MCI1870494.1 single-stranded-DNA-specific exonuclease RecJ [Clostridium sp.]
MEKRWMLRVHRLDKNISRETGIDDITQSILANRGITSKSEIVDFLNPSMDKLHDPVSMKDVETGTDIICDSIAREDKIAVYGDYDADGVTSTYILYNALLRCGADVKYHIPDRIKEGYGMNLERIEKLNSEGISTIITCDNGISAFKEIARARELNMRVIVTDHHDIPSDIPPADAVIDPKQEECPYPFKMLCGAGIAFKFVQVLYRKMGVDEGEALKFIEYAAIGTICDVVDLVGENRIIAKHGIHALNNTQNMGIRALLKENSLEPGNITAYHVGFVLGPCINAAGRLESAETALKLLMAENTAEAAFLAGRLRELNSMRQDMTTKSLGEIVDMVENSELKHDRVVVAYKGDVHESIAGIVAGKLKEKYNLPSIVITKGEILSKGSGRSIEGYDMFVELSRCRDLMENFGGHKMAAGMSIKEDNIDKLRKRLNDSCSLTDEDVIPKIIIDRRLPLESITSGIIKDIKRLEPFGVGNPSPVFAEKNVEVFKVFFMGKDKNTVKLFCRLNNSLNKMDALIFNGGDRFRHVVEKSWGTTGLNRILSNDFKSMYIDIVFFPVFNEYNNNRTIQIIVKDFRISTN